MLHHHIPEDLKFQRLCLYCGSMCYVAWLLTLHLLSSSQHLCVIKVASWNIGLGYMAHLVKETIQTELHLNNFNEDRDLV